MLTIPGIAQYDAEAVHSAETYTYMQPQHYSHFHKLFSSRNTTGCDNLTYTEPDAVIGLERGTSTFRKTEEGSKKPETDKKETKPLPPIYKTEQHSEADKNVTTHVHKTPPPLMAKPTRPPPAIPKAADDFSVPARTPVLHRTTPKPEVNPKNEYANDVPRSRILPTYRDDYVLPPETPKAPSTDSADSGADTKQIPDVKTGDDVKALTIEEVCQFLCALNLESYANIFRENMVDGVLLTSLGREDFLSEFAMKPLEAMRLWNFAQSGHVPK